MNRENRIVQWDSPHKRIIFATPQTFKNDVCTGVCKCIHSCKSLTKEWVCGMLQGCVHL